LYRFCPASGGSFYSANSGLYRAMREAFRAVDHRINDENFLSSFQALDDPLAGPELKALSGEFKLPSRRPHPEPVLTPAEIERAYIVEASERAGGSSTAGADPPCNSEWTNDPHPSHEQARDLSAHQAARRSYGGSQ
jgi:hypothetical protein